MEIFRYAYGRRPSMDIRKTGEETRMVQFCPKCGTQAPDDEAVFCNKCGTRFPPVIPEKQDIFCLRCGTKAPDEQSAFCNKCGSPIQSISPAQIQVAGIRQAAAAARPVMKKKSCPSCSAPLVDEISDYCNVCGANVRRPAPVPPPVRLPGLPHREWELHLKPTHGKQSSHLP